jgi:hypothetical protein
MKPIMGFFSKMEKEVPPKQIAEIEGFLINGETIEQAYSLLLDFAALTNLRVLFVEKEGAEIIVNSIPYSKVTGVALSKQWLSSKTVVLYSSGHRHKINFLSGENAKNFYTAITEKIL